MALEMEALACKSAGVGGRSVVWAEPPDDPADNRPDTEAHRAQEEDVAQRRLRRWLKGMFGGERDAEKNEPDREGAS
jgi:hypothetical protein